MRDLLLLASIAIPLALSTYAAFATGSMTLMQVGAAGTGGSPPAGDYMLLESSGYLLLEDGSKICMEDTAVC